MGHNPIGTNGAQLLIEAVQLMDPEMQPFNELDIEVVLHAHHKFELLYLLVIMKLRVRCTLVRQVCKDCVCGVCRGFRLAAKLSTT